VKRRKKASARIERAAEHEVGQPSATRFASKSARKTPLPHARSVRAQGPHVRAHAREAQALRTSLKRVAVTRSKHGIGRALSGEWQAAFALTAPPALSKRPSFTYPHRAPWPRKRRDLPVNAHHPSQKSVFHHGPTAKQESSNSHC
jgi:hypothetical protein